MSLDSLFNQVAKLKEQMPQPPTTPFANFSFKLHLFTGEEQERAGQLQAKILETGRLSYLSDDERYDLGLLLKLEKALDQEDTQAREKYRRRLHTSVAQLIDAFLALDMSEFLSGDRTWLHAEENGCIYPLDRIGYRTLTKTIEQGTITNETKETLWRWLENVPALAV